MKRLLLLVAFAATGCKGALDLVQPSPDPPKSNAPASIQLTAATRSDYQTTVVAMVYTADRRGVPNLPITFGTGAGTITSQQSATDSTGRATAIVSTPIATIVTAAASGMSGAVEVAATVPLSVIGLPPVLPPDLGNPGLPSVVMNVASIGVTNVSMLFGVSAPGGQTWTWNFGDGTVLQTTAYSIAHTYAAAGTYTATISSPGTRSASSTITISDAPATTNPATLLSATMTCTTSAVHNATCNISTLTYGGTALPSSAITSVSWDWGEGGATSPGVSATHAYALTGTYTIVATVNATTVDGAKTANAVKTGVAVP